MYDPTKPYKEQVLKLIEQTWDTSYVSVKRGVCPIFERKFSYPEVDHTDGIGTKGIYHLEKRTFRSAVLDALAMNLNDLALVGATPYKLQNHIILPEDDHEAILEIIEALSEECAKRKIAITGGETSIHNDAQGLDISMTVSGFIEKQKENKFEAGDVLIGLRSSGLHSNGFTKVRELFGKEFRQEFVEPTRIYSDTILALDKEVDIHGMMHITGGAFTKLKDLLKDADVLLRLNETKLKPHSIFQEIYSRGVSDEEMYKTFNCGIGFILAVSRENREKALAILGEDADVVGEITAGSGKIKIQSAFSDKMIEF